MSANVQPKAGRRRIAITATRGASLVAESMPLIKRLHEAGHDVLCLAPDITEAEVLRLAQCRALVDQIDLATSRFVLMPQRRIVMRMAEQLRKWGPDTVIARGAGVMSLAVMAAKKAGVSRIVAVQEALPDGSEPTSDDDAEFADKTAAKSLVEAFDSATDILCLNYDHAMQLEVSGLLPQDRSPAVLPWCGVDLEAFKVAPLPAIGDSLRFLLIAEHSHTHGILDFCRAAQIVKEESPNSSFEIAGPASRAPDALSPDDLSSFRQSVTFSGDGDNRLELLSRCHVFVYPPSGDVPLGPALEALAVGRPLVTSDAPGTRELLDERVNGCLSRPGDPASIAEAMQSYLKRPDLIPAMARCSRQKAERRFDQRLVLAAIFDLLDLGEGISSRL
jgi:glycosyltransferase involved in cell wall biosynthesis